MDSSGRLCWEEKTELRSVCTIYTVRYNQEQGKWFAYKGHPGISSSCIASGELYKVLQYCEKDKEKL